MYGGGTKPESYCKIGVYIQHNAPSLYDNINDLCLFGAFNTRGNNGVTLLLPDSSTLKKIDKMVGDDSRKALDMIQACILPVFINKVSDFKVGADIPNKLGNKLPIKEVNATSVTLTNGAVIKTDSKFKRLHADGRFAVFLLEGGGVPTTGERSQNFGKKKETKTGSARGGYYGGGCGMDHFTGGNDSSLADYRLREYSDHAWLNIVKSLRVQTKTLMTQRGASGANSTHPDPCTLMTISFMYYLKNSKHKGLYDLLCCIFPISPLTFLHIGYLVDEVDRSEWASTPRSYDKMDELRAIVSAGNMDNSANIAHKKSIIKSFSGPLAGEMSLQCAKHCLSAYTGDAKHSTTIDKYWGSSADFESWYLGAWEHICKLTPVYIEAFKLYSQNPASALQEVDSVFKVHELFVANNGVKRKFDSIRMLTSPRDEMPIQLFCAVITLVMGDFCTSGGSLGVSGGGKEMDTLERLSPNSIVPRSHNKVVFGWWIKTLPQSTSHQ